MEEKTGPTLNETEFLGEFENEAMSGGDKDVKAFAKNLANAQTTSAPGTQHSREGKTLIARSLSF